MGASAPTLRQTPARKGSRIDVVADALESYARRGVFRGFSRGDVKNGRAMFRLVWHWNRDFDLIFDSNRAIMRFPSLLPDVSGNSELHRDLKQFIKSRQSAQLPDHRRIDSKKAKVACSLRGGQISVALTVTNDDYDYGTRKLIGLVQEIFLVFLADSYYDYMVEAFDLDPDRL